MSTVNEGGPIVASRHSPLESALSRHRERRRQSIAAITAFVGPPGSAVSHWREWTCSRAVLLSEATPQALTNALLAFIETSFTPEALFIACLNRIDPSRSAEILSVCKQSPHQAAYCLEHAIPVETRPGMFWLLRQLGRRLADIDGSPKWLDAIRHQTDGSLQQNLELISGIAMVVAGERLPGLMLLEPEGRGGPEWLAEAANSLELLSRHAASVPLAVQIGRSTVESYLHRGDWSRAQSLIAEGRVELAALPETIVRDRVRALMVENPSELECAIHHLATHGGSESSIDLLVEAAAARQDAADDESRSRARSAAEQFLFDRLESRPSTVGVFTLNEQVRGQDQETLEIDLCSRELRIALEIDGYYHFQNSAAYRRDRRKDFALQKIDYLVLRFLANDVVPALEGILNAVDEAIRHRDRRLAKVNEAER